MNVEIEERAFSLANAAHDELLRALRLHPRGFNSPHEGWAVIREELDELWEEVRRKGGGRNAAARWEAIQVAAMGLRYALDLCPEEAQT